MNPSPELRIARAHLTAASAALEETIDEIVHAGASEADAFKALLARINHQRAYEQLLRKYAGGVLSPAPTAERWGLRRIGSDQWFCPYDSDTDAFWPFAVSNRDLADAALTEMGAHTVEFWEVLPFPDNDFFLLRDMVLASSHGDHDQKAA